MRVEIVYIAVILILSVGLTGVSGSDSQDRTEEFDSSEPDQELPSDELLDFLGQWETDKGQWIDPGDLDWLMQPENSHAYED